MKKEKAPPNPLEDAREEVLSLIRAIAALKGEGGRTQLGYGMAEGLYDAPLDVLMALNGGETIRAPYTPFAAKFRVEPPASEEEEAARRVGGRMTSPFERARRMGGR